ncbi:hypothetical protein T459_09597 [Capsicum annuum]|uniref:Condensin complex subunit 1 C-terminal domain-containing protein n=1 Tax=Capsicum annuum TaxID=4072 RepID=A0A2G2ZZX1_CAPAN|nr:hypothetical protein T459_09597 [Capsicum annuum]
MKTILAITLSCVTFKAICVAKLYDINAELVEDSGFLDALKDLISNNNPMVVANAITALAEIQESSSKPIFEITIHTLSMLLTALNKCTKWGQVFILDALSKYKAVDAREAENIVEYMNTLLLGVKLTCNINMGKVVRHRQLVQLMLEILQPATPSALALPGLVNLGMDKNNSAIVSANQPATPTDPSLPDVLPASSG